MDVRHPIDIKESSNPVQKLNLMNLAQDDFKDVRMTPDGLFSVYDAIAKFKKCSTKRAQASFNNIDVSQKLRNIGLHKFTGQGQRETPVCTFTELLQIFSQLPGQQAKVLRKEQAEISSRAIAGDEDLEEAVREQRNKISKNDRAVLMNGLESGTNKLSIDSGPYDKKDLIYSLEFEPTTDIEKEGRKCYNFGVTSDIENRLKSHRSDKEFSKVRLDRCFVYKTRNDASTGERRIKDIICDLGLEMSYFKKRECFFATDEELDIVYKEMIKHTESNKEIDINRNIDTNKTKVLDWFETKIVTYDQLIEILKLI
jgi:hypothetical protein